MLTGFIQFIARRENLPAHHSTFTADRSSPVFESLEGRQLLSAVINPLGASIARDGAAMAVSSPVKTVAPAKASQAAAAVVRAGKTTFSGPITITKGGTYSGNWQSLDARIPAVRIRTNQPVVIENSIIRSRGTLIDVYGYAPSVTVRNVKGYGLNPNWKGAYPGRFLDVDGFTNLSVYNNYMESTGGIYLYNYLGNHTSKQTIKIVRNFAKNIDGRVSNGKGGWIAGQASDEHYKQFVQMNALHNMVGVEIAWNQVVNELGKSRVEENINIHNTWGTLRSPILIHDNYIQGAFASDSIDNKSYTGAGIMSSDNGSSYIRVYNNHIVGTGHIGITITSGHDNAFYNNRIVSDGLLPNGKWDSASNTGGVIWNYNHEKTFRNNTASNNVIGWMNMGERNDWWAPDANGWKNNKPWGKITKLTEAAEYKYWVNKLSTKSVTVGPNF